ncbi:PA0061/PA0062 family lipoprotein [Halopseudomonas sp.]|jgi:hypothetical protein|uniref:PA0061/PA0062 family lipoprotein n=1 Tax=Halopseudomonas sp. TaxID=2901191 RepID=UPI0030038C09
MKTIRVLPCALLLIGCASAPLPPLAQDRARITLDPDVGSLAQAYRLDGEPQRSLRFDDLSTGPHELQVRYDFETPSAGAVQGVMSSGRRTCIMAISHDFGPGRHYRLELARRGWRPAGWLYDDRGNLLTRAREVRCGPGV